MYMDLSQLEDPKPTVEWVPFGKKTDERMRAVVKIEGETPLDTVWVTLIERHYGSSASEKREYRQTSRVYGAIDALVPEFTAEEPYANIAITGETTLDKMRGSVWNAWKRATTAETINRLVPILEQLGRMDGVKVPSVSGIKFSQKAGCTMCPCSPGFVMSCTVTSDRPSSWNLPYNHSGPVDIYIETEPKAQA